MRLIGDPKRRQQMRDFGMERLRTKLAWEFSVPPLLAAYDKAFSVKSLAPIVEGNSPVSGVAE